MKSFRNFLLIDADSDQRSKIQNTLSSADTTVLSAATWEDAQRMVNSDAVNGIIFGFGSNPQECLRAAHSFTQEKDKKHPRVYFLTDTQPEENCILNDVHEITQFVIARKSDLHLIKSKIEEFESQHSCSTCNNEHQNLKEVVKSMENYIHQISDSLRYAQVIQQSLLPGEETMNRIVNDAFLYNRPKDVIGGDFYWFSIKYNRVILAVADCAGHGVPGALLSMIGHNFLNTIVNERNIIDPALILKHMNQMLHKLFEKGQLNNGVKDSLDMGIIVIDPDRRVVEFAGAKRPLFIAKNGIIEKVKADIHSIGSVTPISTDYTKHTIPFTLKDFFYLSSDGAIDQFGGSESRRLGTKQFIKVLESMSHLTAEEQRTYFDLFMNNWKKHEIQTDDILLAGIRPGSLVV
jgi:serine phosphatase RsbU (regulator of sigma subunit)